MEIKESLEDDVVILWPVGRLDSTSSPEFEQFLGARTTDRNRLIIDLSKLDYISSAGLRVILAGAKRIDADSGTMVLCGMKDVIHQIFQVSGFLKILKVEKSLSKAKQVVRR